MGGTARPVLGAAAVPLTLAGSPSPAASAAASAAATVVKPSNTVLGPGLPLFGLGMAHYLPGSNTTAWVRYSRINSARVFASPSRWIRDAQIDDGAGVTGLAAFDAARTDAPPSRAAASTRQRSAPRTTTSSRMATSTRLPHLFGETKALGLEMLVEMDIGGVDTWVLDWGKLWRNWQRCYAHAYHLAKNFGVQRYAFLNEPDSRSNQDTLHSITTTSAACGSPPTPSDAASRTRRRRPAARCERSSTRPSSPARRRAPVVEDPVATNIDANRDSSDDYYGDDVRDDAVGWGQAALQSLHTDYRGVR